MKVEVYNENTVDEKVFLLKLEKCGDYVYLKLVEESGVSVNQGSLLRINPDMTITRTSNIDINLGVPLNVNRQIKMEGKD